MANKYNNLSDLFTATANAIRSKTGSTDPIVADDFPEVIEGMEVGGGDSTEDWVIGDGNTHIWISLPEGRTSPMLGIGVNGTVTVDWGDGTTPDVLTGISTSAVKWTPNHEYAAAGDYVITMTVDGEITLKGESTAKHGAHILRCSTGGDARNVSYQNSLQKIELGNGVTDIEDNAFYSCYSLSSVVISEGVLNIGANAFRACYNLKNISIPGSVTSIGIYAFYECLRLANISIPDGMQGIGVYAFQDCRSITSVALPNSMTRLEEGMFRACYNLISVSLPDGIPNIGNHTFRNCYRLKNISIPGSVTSIGTYAFYDCNNLVNLAIPSGVTSVGSNAFYNCGAVKFYDFTKCAAVPALAATNVFSGIPADCEIRVPAALVDEWKAATNWSTYADYIVGV